MGPSAGPGCAPRKPDANLRHLATVPRAVIPLSTLFLSVSSRLRSSLPRRRTSQTSGISPLCHELSSLSRRFFSPCLPVSLGPRKPQASRHCATSCHPSLDAFSLRVFLSPSLTPSPSHVAAARQLLAYSLSHACPLLLRAFSKLGASARVALQGARKAQHRGVLDARSSVTRSRRTNAPAQALKRIERARAQRRGHAAALANSARGRRAP